MTTIQDRAKGTAFEILYTQKPPPAPLADKELAAKARKKVHNDRHNAKRASMAVRADNKQKANWTI